MRTISVWSLTLAMTLALALGAATVPAQETNEDEPEMKLEVGDEAPDFALPVAEDAAEDTPRRLSDFRGEKEVLVAFYPKAFTPGCTKQLCGYRDDFAKFQEDDVAIVAVSTDKQGRASEFKEKHNLPFMVKGDPQHEIVKAYGVKRIAWTMATRQVFLVDKEGKVSYIDRSYDVQQGVNPLYASLFEQDASAAE